MKTPAIIASLTVVGSIAFAAGQDRVISRPIPQAKPTLTEATTPPEQRLGADSGPCDPEQWFDPTPREFLAGCGTLATLPLSPADVNADGIPEILVPIGLTATQEFIAVLAPNNDSMWCGIYQPATSVPVDILQWLNLKVTSEGATPNSRAVCNLPTSFGDFFRARLPDPGGAGWCTYSWEVRGKILGWLDCDADGDLDLVIRMTTYKMNSHRVNSYCVCDPETLQSQISVWLENTGFQRNNLLGDLDGDGRVDGSDLGVLLANWGS